MTASPPPPSLFGEEEPPPLFGEEDPPPLFSPDEQESSWAKSLLSDGIQEARLRPKPRLTFATDVPAEPASLSGATSPKNADEEKARPSLWDGDSDEEGRHSDAGDDEVSLLRQELAVERARVTELQALLVNADKLIVGLRQELAEARQPRGVATGAAVSARSEGRARTRAGNGHGVPVVDEEWERLAQEEEAKSKLHRKRANRATAARRSAKGQALRHRARKPPVQTAHTATPPPTAPAAHVPPAAPAAATVTTAAEAGAAPAQAVASDSEGSDSDSESESSSDAREQLADEGPTPVTPAPALDFGLEDWEFVVERSVVAWARGKDIVSMLRTIEKIWPDGAIRPGSLVDPCTPAAVRREYLRTVRTLHPDKAPKNCPEDVRLLRRKLFTAVTDAYQSHR